MCTKACWNCSLVSALLLLVIDGWCWCCGSLVLKGDTDGNWLKAAGDINEFEIMEVVEVLSWKQKKRSL